jgi:hypothetical protein
MSNIVKRLRDWQHVYPEDQDKTEGHLYEEAAGRIEELEAKLVPQWQPIETAPKAPEHEHTTFGPMVVLASKYGHRAIGYWSDGRGALPAGWVNPHDHLIMIYWNAFTHWMPLPAPPTE